MSSTANPPSESPPQRFAFLVIPFALLVLFVFGCVARQATINHRGSLDAWPGEKPVAGSTNAESLAAIGVEEVMADQIAHQIATQNQFATDYGDIAWLESYSARNGDGKYDWIFILVGGGTTTAESPGFPFALSVCYRVYSREWSHIRLLNIAILALGLTFLVTTVRRYAGWLAAILAALLIAVDGAILGTAGLITADAMTTGMVAITFSVLIRTWNRPRESERPSWRWFLIGALFGMTLLLSFRFELWLIQIIALFVVVLIVRLVRRQNSAALIQGSALFFFGLIMVAGPWWARNCRVTEQFAPFGSATGIRLVGAYCDRSYENDGNWQQEVAELNRDEHFMRFSRDDSELETPQVEMAIAAESIARSRQWADENVSRLPPLMLMRARSHLVPGIDPTTIVFNSVLLLAALIGILIRWKRIGTWLVVAILLSLFTTLFTGSLFGSYAIPVRPLILCAAAIGAIGVVYLVTAGGGKTHRAEQDVTTG